MDKNSVIGFILMALVLFGFTFYQNRQAQQYAEAQKEYQEKQDSILLARMEEDSLSVAAGQAVSDDVPVSAEKASIYKDGSLNAHHSTESRIVSLENDKFEVEFNTRGAQPWSVRLKDFTNYGGSDLYVFRPGDNQYSLRLYAGQDVLSTEFTFDIVEQTDTTLVMRLPFDNGGYIEQYYAISEGSYLVKNEIRFRGVGIPRNVSSVDMDFLTTIPRMEKGYKNESQYSKVDYYFDGDKKPVELGRGRSGSKKISSKLSWFAFQQQFFCTIVKAPTEFSSGEIRVDFCKEDDPAHNLMACQARMRMDIIPGRDLDIPLELYYGPNHFKTLKQYGSSYEKIIPLGGWLVGWFTKYFIIPMFNFLHRFISNFGLIILIMTLIIKLIVLPFTWKSFSSSAKMAALKPLLEELNKKYPKQEDAMKKQQATMDLYKRADCSPMGGCLPTLLTFPILWAMFRFFPASIELRQQSFLWAEDLSAYDSIVDFGTRVPLIGDHLSLFALLMAVVMWLYSRMTMNQQAGANDPSAASMKFMSVWMMPIMMFFICNNLSSGLSYYYLLSQLISMIQMFFIKRSVKPEAVLAKVEAS
ncbi:MAG: membrane protein insertase YidC, partial [Bacteroidales bacterium]|nr:membrane protein insertase YidC [Bacteroidales bacterium]